MRVFLSRRSWEWEVSVGGGGVGVLFSEVVVVSAAGRFR